MLTFEQQKAEIASLNLTDDPFFLEVMQDLAICEEILRILLQKPDLIVLSNQVDRTIPNLAGKAVKLDLICTDSSGNIINVEMQKSNDTNHQKRVRYNMASIDTNSTGINPLFKKLSSQIYYYKETPEGVTHMSNAFDRYADAKVAEKVAERDKEMAVALLKKKIMPLSEIAELTKLPLEEIEALQKAI